MDQPLTNEEVSRCFKEIFSNKSGQIVLERLMRFCRGDVQQSLACIESVNQTFYNLGANAVYRFIQYMIDMPLDQTDKDCVIEIKEEEFNQEIY